MTRFSERRHLKDNISEQQLFANRALIGLAIVIACFLALVVRYFWLQVVRYDDFTVRSESNRVQVRPVAPNRGIVYDRRGRVLASNQPAYRLEIIPEKAGDVEELFEALGEILPLTDDDRQRYERIRSRYRYFDSIPLKFNLDEASVSRFAVNRHRFDGVDVVPYLSRHYPHGELLTHVLGYVGRLDESDLSRVDAVNYRGTTHIGKAGIEQRFESALHGQIGLERVETNASGRVLEVLERQNPTHGDDLILSLDLVVQQAAWDALGDHAGAVIAIDPRDASIVAMVSKPAFDPNLFVHGISQVDYQALLAAPRRPLFNRALNGGYQPGSTIKPFVGLAGLELGVISREQRVFSNGEFLLEGQKRPYRDWREGGHGWVTIISALEQSVNTYFYALAEKLGIDRIHDYLLPFGFGQRTGVDLVGESSGLLPSRDWKRGRYGEPWYPGETVIAGIGQGFIVVTPLQLANALTTLVNDGNHREPHLLWASKQAGNTPAQRQSAPVISRVPVRDLQNWQAIRDGMHAVVNGPSGTARAIAIGAPYEIAGKSGTAQVYGLSVGEEYEASEVAEQLRDHALFVAYAPAEQPSLVVAVVLDHGGSGSRVASPLARLVLDAWMAEESNL
jgi:penicillin-binding protein 2